MEILVFLLHLSIEKEQLQFRDLPYDYVWEIIYQMMDESIKYLLWSAITLWILLYIVPFIIVPFYYIVWKIYLNAMFELLIINLVHVVYTCL